MIQACDGQGSAGGGRRWLEIIVPALLVLPMPLMGADGPVHSALWGRDGEAWRPDGRLPDFSYAGYHRGEKLLPTLEPAVSVKDFGAVGDGQADDTEAFKKAIREGKGTVIAIPAGRYRITDFLDVRTRGTCLKGAGSDRSILVFPRPLNEIKPNWGATTSGQRTSNYSWSGGFVRVIGSFSRELLADVTGPALRGDTSLVVSKPQRFRPGDEIRLTMADTPDNTLARHVYEDDPGKIENLKGRVRESFICRIRAVEPDAHRIRFDRPLRIDVRLEWKPRIYPASSSVEEVGIEGFGFAFPDTPYGGHFTEVGYNALAMSGVRHCWARDLRIHNGDSGMFISGANVTLQGIVIDSERQTEKQRRATGHHGVTLGGQDNLLTDFTFHTRFIHDITVSNGSAGNVAAGGRGVDLALDHHCHGPHANLFTDIDLGEGSRMFQSGGGAALGRHSGAYETFWCVRARRSLSWPKGWGPDLMNLVGLASDQPSVTDPRGKWFEALDPDRLVPRNLYQAQLARRRTTAGQ